jgi:hypothetical protein
MSHESSGDKTQPDVLSDRAVHVGMQAYHAMHARVLCRSLEQTRRHSHRLP